MTAHLVSLTMDQKLASYFLSLKEEAEAVQKGASTDLVESINDISKFCEELVTDQDVSLGLAAVFDGTSGIFAVVESLLHSHDRGVQKARERCLVFMADFIRKTTVRAAPYAPFIKNQCISIFQRDESKSVQTSALLPLMALLDLCMQNHALYDLSFDWSTVKMLLLEYRKAKSSGTCSVENAKRLYTYLEQVLLLREDLKRYEMVKDGLRLLSRHACLFRIHLVENYSSFLKWLEAYCNHVNAQLRDAAHPAFNAFMSQVAEALASDDRRITNAPDIYKKLFVHALEILDGKNVSSRLIRLAICMMGKLSPVVLKFSGKHALKQVFQRIVSLGSFSERENEQQEESIGFAMTLVGAYANIIINLDVVDNYMITIVTQAVGKIFYGFPHLFPKQKPLVYTSLHDLFLALSQKGEVFSIFLTNIVWSLLERAIEPVKASPGETHVNLWKSYSELWLALLDIQATPEKGRYDSDDAQENVEEKSEKSFTGLQTTLFDSIMKCVIKAMKELNIKYRVRLPNSVDKENEDIDRLGEPDSDKDPIEPLNEVDMQKFLNLVEFMQDILSSQFVALFQKWVHPFGRCLVELSSCYPLISGFYKLLTLTIELADQEHYFKGAQEEDEVGPRVNVLLQGAFSVSEEERAMCKELLRHYLQEVLISCKRYKLELLASCLHFCLSAPPALIGIDALVQPINVALKMGLRYHLLADIAMNALERWISFCKCELEKHLEKILPCFSPYLSAIKPSDISESDSHGSSRLNTGGAALSRLRRTKGRRSERSQPDKLCLLQIRMQNFLGRIGRHAHFLVPSLDLLQLSGVGGSAWDTSDHIKFILPFRDEKVDIWLDSLLPRVVDLALSANDRRTKVVASELLHALCLLMIGNSAKGPMHRQNRAASNANYGKIYRKLFPEIIRLGADVEQVSRDLFTKLVMQTIHWFTSNSQKENPDTMALLDSILEGLVDSENASLREFCAECFEEFMRWSIRHAPPEADNFVNVTSMLRRLYNRLNHPNPYHRLGASMACSRLYPVLRENRSIVDRYIFEMLYFCIKSMIIAELDHEQIGTVKQLRKVLENFAKLVNRNIQLLSARRKDRAMFTELDEFLEWLFTQTVKLEERCRNSCMQLFVSICAVSSIGSPAAWFETFRRSGNVEKTLQVLEKEDTFDGQTHATFRLADFESFLRALGRSLHWFEWALQTHLISLEEVAVQAPFIRSAIGNALEQLSQAQFQYSLTPTELECHKEISFRAVMYLIRFMKEVLCYINSAKGDSLPVESRDVALDKISTVSKILPLESPELVRFLCLILLAPWEVGIMLVQSDKNDYLARLSMKTMQILPVFSIRNKKILLECLQSLLCGERLDLDLGQFIISFEVVDSQGSLTLEQARCLLRGYQQLLYSGMLHHILGEAKSTELAERILKKVCGLRGGNSVDVQAFYGEMLCFAISLGVTVQKLLECVLDQTPVPSSTLENEKLTAGSLFYLNFRKVIIQQVKFAYKESLPFLLKSASGNYTSRLLVSALLDDYLSSSIGGNNITVGSFVKEFAMQLTVLEPCCSSDGSYNDRLFFFEVLHKLLTISAGCQILPLSKQTTAAVTSITHPFSSSFTFMIEGFFSCLARPQTSSAVLLGFKDKNMDLLVQCSALSIIPFFFRQELEKSLYQRLTGTLMNIVTAYLLVREEDLPVGSNQRAMYIQTLEKLLDAVCLARNAEVLEVLFPIFQNMTALAKGRILKSLEQFACSIEDERDSVCSLNLAVLQDETKVPRLKRAVTELVFLPVMEAAPSSFVLSWFKDHIEHLFCVLSQRYQHPHLSADNEEDYLTVKACHYMMIATLFKRADAIAIKVTITPVVSNQQLMQIATNDSRAKDEPEPHPFPENDVFWHELHMQAYNCLSWLVMCTQDQEKIFTILFKDFAGRPLWRHLIDCNKVYDDFPVETSQLGSLQEITRNLRLERKNLKKMDGLAPSLSSQYIVGATLSQEPVLTRSGVETEAIKEQEEIIDGYAMANVDDALELDTDVVEGDNFDHHPCLLVALKLISHLHSKHKGTEMVSGEMPEWMKALHNTLSNAGTHVNVCLFIVKLVVKARKAFAQYASNWFIPILQLFLKYPESTGGKKFHYMLRDVCITILDWHVLVPPDTSIASQFLNYLLEITPHQTTQVMWANLEIVRSFLMRWKAAVSIDLSIIASFLAAGGDSLSSSDKGAVIHRSIGLQLLGAFAAVGLPLYIDLPDSKLTQKVLVRNLLFNLSHKTKNIYEASAELLGLLLKQHEELQQEHYLGANLKQTLLTLYKDGELGKFLSIVDKITLYCPVFVKGYSSIIFDLLPRVHGVFRIASLSIILRSPSAIPNLFNMMLPLLSKLLTHKDEFAQIKSLELVAELVKEASKQTIIEQVLPLLSQVFSSHDSIECRKHYYKILIYLYTAKDMVDDELVIRGLLLGLSDKSAVVKEMLQSFWHGQLSKNPQRRFLETVTRLYNPLIEDHWVSIANALLLKLCEDAVDYNRPIFNAPLSDCEFREYTIDPSLLSGTLPMTPMFTKTQAMSTQSQGTEDAQYDAERTRKGISGMVRATMVDSLSQMAESTRGQSLISSYSMGGESALFALPQISRDVSVIGDHIALDMPSTMKRRLVHPSGSRQQMIRNVLNSMKRKEAHAAQQALERANKIQIMRRYRIGELPDIEIKHEEIINPLVALGELDPTLSRLLLISLCRSFYSLPIDRSLDPGQELRVLVTKGIERALEKTVNNISFVNCALSLCLENKEAWIQPKVIGSASSKSTNFQSGILLLENVILQGNDPGQCNGNVRKRQKGVSGNVTMDPNTVKQAWWELAGLYRAIGETDIVLSIFKKHLTDATVTYQALEAELEGNLMRALELYDKAIDQFDEGQEELVSASEIEQDMWWTRRLHCMAALLNWHGVMSEVLYQVGESSLERLWETREQDSYLSLFVRAAIKMPTHHSVLTKFIEPISEDSSKREIILSSFSTQITSLAVSNDQLDLARFYNHESYKTFIRHWTESHPLAVSARHREIRQLQKVAELNEFLELSASKDYAAWRSLFAEWRTRWPSTTLDDAEAWDDIVQNRLLFFQKLQSAFNKDAEKGKEEQRIQFAIELDKERVSVFFEAARGLMKQRNYVAAKGFMNQFVALRDSRKEKLDFYAYKHIVKLRCLEASHISELDSEKAVQMLQQVLSYIGSTMQKYCQHKQWQIGFRLLEGRASSQLGWLILEKKILSLSSDESNTGLKFLGSAYAAYSNGISFIDNQMNDVSPHLVAKSLLKYASFCDQLLKSSQSSKLAAGTQALLQRGGESLNLPSASTYPILIVKLMMRAFNLDCSLQVHYGLARVLTLVGQYPDVHEEFASAIKNIASWLFIPWIPQLLASIDKHEGESFIAILEDIAKLCPQAIYFPYNVSRLDFGPLGRERAKLLHSILKNPTLEGLVRGLEDLTFPEQRLRDGLSLIKSCLESGKHEKAKDIFRSVFEDCLDVQSMSREDRQSGEYNLKFARDYCKKLVDVAGQDGVKLTYMDGKKFGQATNNIMGNLQKALKTLPIGNLSLHSFSKWLADFDQTEAVQFAKQGQELEMFGSYDGQHEPDPTTHVKIVSFDQMVVSLNSKQRPKLIKIRGSDEREYKFIVKGGEDLRLDQRIEQLFGVMNNILARDPSCSRRKLFVPTYSVIPISRQCGLLQFVENTRSLDDVIKDGLACTLPSLGSSGKTVTTDVMSNLRMKYHEWLEKKGGSQNLADCYRSMYAGVPFNEMAEKLGFLASGIPWDTLRSGLFKLTTSAESFIALRSQYQRSLAVTSICGYIAGVGDRHLSNILVDVKRGSLVPIDFGYSFGTGVILLPVPELIPFRMTTQLINVLLPQDALGLLRTDMIRMMAALRSSKDVISAVMDVFVKEPLLDWKVEAMKTSHSRDIGSPQFEDPDASHEQQHVALKVEFAHRKLELWNPADVTIAELHSSIHAGNPYMRQLEDIVKGAPDRNIRARIHGNICESLQEQVDCLLDQATDPNLLGRIWLGWQPWI